MNRRELYAALGKLKGAYGGTPLGHLDSPFAVDRCGVYLGQVSALLSFMSAAYEDSGDLLRKQQSSEVDNRDPSVIAAALDGVASLVDLVAVLLEDERS